MASGTEIQRVADEETLAHAAAGLFVRLARQGVADRGRFTVAPSGGSTPRRVFELLAASPLRDRVPWDRVEVFWGDERAVPPGHADSNYGMARAMLLDAVPVTPERVHRMRAEGTDLAAAAGDYQAEIARVFGVSGTDAPPPFDLVLLGMGDDGHTLSLFPSTPALEPTERWVVSNAVPQLETRRLTMTPALVNRARCVAFMVAGGGKTARLAEVLEGPEDHDRLPAQLIRPRSGRLIWLVDRAAAARLEGEAVRAVRLAPSILAADFTRLGEQVAVAARAGADRLHVDVMDGHFVPNISIGPVVIESLRRVTTLPLETHLMISDPWRYAEPFVEAGSDRILFHQEVADDPVGLARRIRDLGASPGIVINPDTPAAAIAEIVPHVDMTLVMTVHPGFGGQRFIDEMLPKIAAVRELIDREHPACELEVDGGIDTHTAGRAVEAGARVLVAGSAIFGPEAGIEAAMEELRHGIADTTMTTGSRP